MSRSYFAVDCLMNDERIDEFHQLISHLHVAMVTE